MADTIADVEAQIADLRRQADHAWARGDKGGADDLHNDARELGRKLCKAGVHGARVRGSCVRCGQESYGV